MTEGSVWFRAAIGRNKNAEARWLLPMICRRGGIGKGDIGAIRIFDASTEFEISANAADEFAQKIRRPDKEDNIRIEALPDGPQGDAQPAKRGKPDYKGKNNGKPAYQGKPSHDDRPARDSKPRFEGKPHYEGKPGPRGESKHEETFRADNTPARSKKPKHSKGPEQRSWPEVGERGSFKKSEFAKKPKKKKNRS
jgi:ATP-dependent RNA helicase DeaD